ncbi:MAG: hypothetical protein ACK5LL_04085 [Suipraeoptans sp.]
MKFNKDIFQQHIGNSYESDMIDILNAIDSCAEERCNVSPDTLELVHVAAKESYLAALKTIEDALISSCETSDKYSPES